jgi:hypothetical protein
MTSLFQGLESSVLMKKDPDEAEIHYGIRYGTLGKKGRDLQVFW